jgi:hypothetical protein
VQVGHAVAARSPDDGGVCAVGHHVPPDALAPCGRVVLHWAGVLRRGGSMMVATKRPRHGRKGIRGGGVGPDRSVRRYVRCDGGGAENGLESRSGLASIEARGALLGPTSDRRLGRLAVWRSNEAPTSVTGVLRRVWTSELRGGRG